MFVIFILLDVYSKPLPFESEWNTEITKHASFILCSLLINELINYFSNNIQIYDTTTTDSNISIHSYHLYNMYLHNIIIRRYDDDMTIVNKYDNMKCIYDYPQIDIENIYRKVDIFRDSFVKVYKSGSPEHVPHGEQTPLFPIPIDSYSILHRDLPKDIVPARVAVVFTKVVDFIEDVLFFVSVESSGRNQVSTTSTFA
jgi:hypothetical protein